MDHAVGNVEIFAEAPFVAGAQNGGNSGYQVVVDVGGSEVGKWFKKFGGLPCIQGASEILAGALEFMVGMVKHCALAEVFLELAKQASRKTGLLLEVHVVEARGMAASVARGMVGALVA